MKMKWLPLAAFFLAAAVVGDYGCGGGSSVNNIFSPPPVSPSPNSASTTIPLAANTALPMPAFAGFSGTFTEVNNVAPGTTVQLTTQITQPAGAPAPLDGLRHKLPSVSKALAATASLGTPVVWVGQAYSAGVTFNAFPVTTWQLPPSLSSAGPFELEEFDGTTGTLIDIELSTSVSSGVVNFGGSSAPFTTIVGHQYWWELITGFSQPSASPTPCGQTGISPTLNPAGQTVMLPAVCGFGGSLNFSANNASANNTARVVANVPALLGLLGPPAKPGTTTGVLTISTDIDVTATFNSGMYQFAVALPSSIPTAGKSFFMSGCTIEIQYFSGGGVRHEFGCTDNPLIVGPLVVSGQTVSYAGLPFPLMLTGGRVPCGPNGKFCRFYYTTSIFY